MSFVLGGAFQCYTVLNSLLAKMLAKEAPRVNLKTKRCSVGDIRILVTKCVESHVEGSSPRLLIKVSFYRIMTIASGFLDSRSAFNKFEIWL